MQTFTSQQTQNEMLGLPEYQNAMDKWQEAYGTYSGMMSQVSPQLNKMNKYYQPGGGYGKGLRQEAKENVQGGVNKDLASMVSTGMSSTAGARGLQTQGGTELSKMYKNIEDTRNQLWQQSITPYAQMMTSLSQMQSSMPTYRQYATPFESNLEYGYGGEDSSRQGIWQI
jgi:hypothetical protein